MIWDPGLEKKKKTEGELCPSMHLFLLPHYRYNVTSYLKLLLLHAPCCHGLCLYKL